MAEADVAAHPAFGSPLLSVRLGSVWNERELVRKATVAARKQFRGVRPETTKFVAYSYPKIAVQFLKGETEVAMVELYTGLHVPPERRRRPGEPPANFERWSFLRELPPRLLRKRVRRFQEHVARWNELFPSSGPRRVGHIGTLGARAFVQKLSSGAPGIRWPYPFPIIVDTEELHYSRSQTDHHPCYELRGQLTSVWCVAASVHMLLDFYRFNYPQTRLAQELGLGTLANPNGLPYSRSGDVVTVLQKMTSNALSASWNQSPTWAQFTSEIHSNRPLISFIPGHSRTVAGFTSTSFPWFPAFLYRGLLVYDPWPPTTGVITRWENFDAQTYTNTFTAQLTLV